MTKIKYIIPTATALLASALGLATAPAQAATVTYNGCASTSFCTITELLAGGYIEVDENDDGTIEKVFANWMNYEFSKNPMGNPLTDPQANIQVSATGTYIPGVSGSATLNYTIPGGINLAPPSGNVTWTSTITWEFTVTSLEYVPIMEQIDALTSASVTSPPTGAGSFVSFNGAMIMGNTPPLPVTDTMTLGPTNVYTVMDSLSLSARRTTAAPGTASVMSFSQTFTQKVIPEPGTVVGLLAVGGLGLAMKRRQKDS
ncbi:PEP-CTERM sorting domain-containing protein [Microcystis aeruginosa CS-563/04]|uniref:PEP-CTERM sorting domain-containing protein n=1 Tax=Microcystis aeruginosa TaxID=1126 RepID=UPI00232BE5F3|nr:PEP-CTERM sorting domain-containing protein [Microcystis aeruginosa]MDB9420847.1 PEP-CTERM sorting domain-containing protein [Microcystis aeruginosa CS-563/04]